MASVLMMAGAGLCTLAVLTLLTLVITVIWQGEGHAGSAPAGREWADQAAPSRSRPRRKSRGRLRTAGAPLLGGVVLGLALLGVLGCMVFVAGYFLSTAGSNAGLNAFLDSARGKSHNVR